VTKNRLEAFSDGVFAIAITLLVIEIRPPQLGPGETLWHALLAQWPSYVGYLVSFATIGVIWLNHHRMFEQVARRRAAAGAQPRPAAVDGASRSPPRWWPSTWRAAASPRGPRPPSTPRYCC
jgi:hypothetical protein